MLWGLASIGNNVAVTLNPDAATRNVDDPAGVDQGLRPRVVQHRSDVEPKIRAALRASPADAVVDLPGLRLELLSCASSDGTPVWDFPSVSWSSLVRVRRADGVRVDHNPAGEDWDRLTAVLVEFLAGWDIEVVRALTVARDAAHQRRGAEAALETARAAERAATVAAHSAGASWTRIGKVIDRSPTVIKKWI